MNAQVFLARGAEARTTKRECHLFSSYAIENNRNRKRFHLQMLHQFFIPSMFIKGMKEY